MRLTRAPLLAAWFLCASALADEAAGPAYVPYQSSGIYALADFCAPAKNADPTSRSTPGAGCLRIRRSANQCAWC